MTLVVGYILKCYYNMYSSQVLLTIININKYFSSNREHMFLGHSNKLQWIFQHKQTLFSFYITLFVKRNSFNHNAKHNRRAEKWNTFYCQCRIVHHSHTLLQCKQNKIFLIFYVTMKQNSIKTIVHRTFWYCLCS